MTAKLVPREELHLFNPLFCSLVLRSAASGHLDECGAGLPFAEAFLVMPIVFTKAIRNDLTGWITTKLRAWLAEHDYHLLGIARRCRSFVPHTRKAILFGYTHGYLGFANTTLIPTGPVLRRRRSELFPKETSEVKELKHSARYVGRWFARAGDEKAIFGAWGLRP